MFDTKNDKGGRHASSLLSLGEALRASRPLAQSSRLTEALAQVRAERQAATAASASASTAPSENAPKRPLPKVLDRSADRDALAPEESDAPPRPGVAWARPKEPADVRPVERAEEIVAVVPERPAPVMPQPVDEHIEPAPVAPGYTRAPSAFDDPAASGMAGAPMAWRPLIDPGTVVSGVFRSKKIIVATTILGTALGVLVALNTPKTYDSTTELLASPSDLNLVDKELTQSGISNEATLAIVDNRVRILTSGRVLTKVANRLHLADDPEFNGQGSGQGLSGLIGKARSVFLSDDTHADPGRRQGLAIENLSKALSVERSGKTFVIVVRARTQSAEKSKMIASTMADVFLESSGDIQSDAAGRAAAELTGRLDELRKGVEAAERKVEAFRSENDLIDAQGRLITDDEILKLNEQLSIARARTLELNARAASTRKVDVDSVLGGVIPEALASPNIQDLRSQYSTLKGEADRVAVRLGPKHPSLMAIRAQLAGARELIDTEIRRVVVSNQTELKRAVQLEQELASRLAQLKVRQGSLSNQLVSLREIERDATAKRAVYESFLLRARETGEQQGINSANIAVLSDAYAPLNANGPSRSTIAGAGMVLGFLAGIGIGGARGTFDSLRGTARGDAGPTVPAGPNAERRRRRRLATMFDSPQAPDAVTPDPAKVEPDAAMTADPTSTDSPIADSPAQAKNEAMHQYQPDHWAPDQAQNPQAQHSYTAMPMQGYPQAAVPTGYANAAPAYAQAAMPQTYAPQPYAYPQAMPDQPIYQPQAQPKVYPQHAATPQHGYPQAMPHRYWPQAQHAGMPHAPVYAPLPQPAASPQAQSLAQPHPQDQAYRARPVPSPLQHAQREQAATSQLDEIRASLRECRAAIRELAEARSGRRYF